MEVLFENSYARFWQDGTSPILYSRVEAVPPTMEGVQEIFDAYNQAILVVVKNYGKIYTLSDFSEIKSMPSTAVIRLYINFLPSLKIKGIVFKAFVIPKIPLVKTIVNEITANVVDIKWGLYDKFEQALGAINCAMEHIPKREKSLLSRILFW
jgi:hypothetical protein